jgi:ribosome biogenesis GTPase
MAAKKPIPVLETVDKMIAIAEHNRIEPVVVITKSDLDSQYAKELVQIYEKAGLHTFITSSDTDDGLEEFRIFVEKTVAKIVGRV